MTTKVRQIVNGNKLGASFTASIPDTLVDSPTRPYVDLIIGVAIDDGAGGEPADLPNGYWALACSWDGVAWFNYEDGKKNTQRSMVVQSTSAQKFISKRNQMVVFERVPNMMMRLEYKRDSGGGSDTRCNVWSEMMPSEQRA